MKPTFEKHAEATIERARATFEHRGTEYSDDWKEVRPLTLRAVADKLGVNIPPRVERAIMWAVLCDLKYQRRMGGYKDDTIIDSINYEAVLAEEMRLLEKVEEIKFMKPIPVVTELKRVPPVFSRILVVEELTEKELHLHTVKSDWWIKFDGTSRTFDWTPVTDKSVEDYVKVGEAVFRGVAYGAILGIPATSADSQTTGLVASSPYSQQSDPRTFPPTDSQLLHPESRE